MDWWDRFENMRNERRKAHESSQERLGPKQIWVPKYANDKAILEHLMGAGVDALDPVLFGVTTDDLMDLVGGWDEFDA